jgi:hypothetical protein
MQFIRSALLAHLPRVVREENLATMYYLAAQTGTLLLAIDVILSTDVLWKRSESLEVEPPIQHVTVADVVNQFVEFGISNQNYALRLSQSGTAFPLLLAKML